ncbi:UNVERIFIED_CONTAM: hypothetical protein HDU68_002806 [Siphonaria sp. JEL0065]|nr:hypothetical protein HDU68_002806 [Siphonaria sp. JEL0065]
MATEVVDEATKAIGTFDESTKFPNVNETALDRTDEMGTAFAFDSGEVGRTTTATRPAKSDTGWYTVPLDDTEGLHSGRQLAKSDELRSKLDPTSSKR